MKKFNDINTVRSDIKRGMRLDEFIRLADARYSKETGNPYNPIERVNDHLFKKKCDLDSHPMDSDGSRDSTASFTICPPKELWHCFGCGSGGDRFEYISHRFNMTHIEAINIAAEIQGFDLTPYMVELTEEEKIKMALFNENDTARNLAHETLLKSPRALDYLHSRGITDDAIELFKIGYAPELDNYGNTMFNNIPNSITLQLNRRDQFNDAILFPICDANGKMRYFQSRPFNPIPGMKYIGGNDTHPLFDETDRVYGFDIARKLLYKSKGRLVGVEGAPDTIACMQQGIIASGFLGTAINQNTFDLLDKYSVTELILLLDGDKAGRDKTIKNSEKYLTLNTNVRLKVALLPDGYDPEEFINACGGDKLKEIIDDSVYAVQYLIDSKWNNATTPTAKIDYMNSITPYMATITDKVVRQIMIAHISLKIGLDPVQIEDYYMEKSNTTGNNLYSIEGEEILLAEAMRNADFVADITMRFRDDDWYLLKHRHLFRILKSTEYTDVDSVYMIAKNMNIDNIITHSWLQKLYSVHGNVEFSLLDVEDKLMRRKSLDIIEKAKKKVSDMSNDIELVIDQSTTDMYGVAHRGADEKIHDVNSQVMPVMDEILNRMSNPVDIIGISHGRNFQLLDKYTLGMQKKTLTIVAANQSVGKTQICENWAIDQSVLQGENVLWFSLEMDKNRMTYRNLAIMSGVSAQDMMKGNITVEQKADIDQCALKLLQSKFFISEKGHDLSEALAIARRYVMRHKVTIVYVDYAQLQYVTDRRTETRSRELGVISKAWKEFSQDMDVPVVLISQLGKQALEAETAEAEHGFGSYEMAQDADNYYTLKDKHKEEIEMNGIEHGNKTFNISKNRMGEKTVLIDIYADGPTYRMTECQCQ